jgi:hypothetical protein
MVGPAGFRLLRHLGVLPASTSYPDDGYLKAAANERAAQSDATRHCGLQDQLSVPKPIKNAGKQDGFRATAPGAHSRHLPAHADYRYIASSCEEQSDEAIQWIILLAMTA